MAEQPVRRPRPGKIGMAVRKHLKTLDVSGVDLVSVALAEATADLADLACRGGKAREFSTLLKDLERLLGEVHGDVVGEDDAGEVGGVEPKPVEPRGLAAVLGTGSSLGHRKVS